MVMMMELPWYQPRMIGYKNLLKYHLINVGQVAYILVDPITWNRFIDN